MPSILISNNTVKGYTGSELVTLDIAAEFKHRGYDVTIATFGKDASTIKSLDDLDVNWLDLNIEQFSTKFREFDIIWSHHFTTLDTILMDMKIIAKTIIFSSMSPYEPLESPPIYAEHLSLILANSDETKNQLLRYGLSAGMVYTFPNPVAREWFSHPSPRLNSNLKKLAIISNHVTAELEGAVEHLQGMGVVVDIIGINHKYLQVTPATLTDFDCIVTIGRTVQQAMVLGIPVYCYDRYGGPGYIRIYNLEECASFNYSGRCCGKIKTSKQIANELVDDYTAATKDTPSITKIAREKYRLDLAISQALDIAENRKIDANSISTVLELPSRMRRYTKIPHNKLFSQLYLDYGDGLSEEKSIKIRINGIQASGIPTNFLFEIPNEKLIKNLRLDPLNKCAIISIHKIELSGPTGTTDITAHIKSNAKYFHNEKYYFITDDPQLFFENCDLTNATQLKASLTYEAIETSEILESISRHESNLGSKNDSNEISRQLQSLKDDHQKQEYEQSRKHENSEKIHALILNQAQKQIENQFKLLAQQEAVSSETLIILNKKHEQKNSLLHKEITEQQRLHFAQLGEAKEQIRLHLLELAERERIFSAKIQAVQNEHEQQKNKLRREHEELEKLHLSELSLVCQKIEAQLLLLVDREKTLTEQLKIIQRDHVKAMADQQTQHIEREKTLVLQLERARQIAESSLQKLAEREKYFLARVQEIYAGHDQEKERRQIENARNADALSEQLLSSRLQIEDYLLKLAERERNFSEKFINLSQDYESKSTTQFRKFVIRENELNAQLTTTKLELEKKLSDFSSIKKEYELVISGLHRELNAMRRTISWRWTAPLRKLRTAARTKQSDIEKITFNNSETAMKKYLLSDCIASTNISPPRFSNTDSRIPGMTLRHNISAPERALEELLSLHDESFVHQAYEILLGRSPDPDGMNYYLGRVRAGVSKIEIVSQLTLSNEGKLHQAKNSDLQKAVKKYKWLKTSLFGLIFGLFSKRHSGDNIQTQIRLINNKIHSIEPQLQNRLSEISRSINQLRRLIESQETVLQRGQKTNNTAILSEDPLQELMPLAENQNSEIKENISSENLVVDFDEDWYFYQYPDIASLGLTAYEHYTRYGKSQCRIPFFDREWYIQEYPDVALSGMEPYDHYLQHGKTEGRHPAFSADWYLNEYPDIAEAGVDPYEHYQYHGKFEGRYPAFDRNWYLAQYPDVAASGVDPYNHYVQNGKMEGRHPAYHPKQINRRGYQHWIAEYDTLTENMRAGMRRRINNFSNSPLISVLMPVYNSNIEWLKEAIDSVKRQIYQNWELCIADDASSDPSIKLLLEDYSRLDPRIKVVIREKNGHISAASNSALSLASGEWIALLDHDDLIAEHALFWVVDAINRNPNSLMIYSDDDNINEQGERSNPYFKCDWNPDLFYSQNLFGHLGVYNTKMVQDVGGFRLGMEGSQDYDLALRCLEKIDVTQVHHIPRILYHWRVHAESTAFSSDAKPYAMIAGEKAINEHFERQGIDAKVEFNGYAYRAVYALPEELPLVSLIIPTRNGLDVLQQCIESIIKKTTYTNYELIVVDNSSDDKSTISYLQKISSHPLVQVIRDERPFNYSAINNAAVKKANGQIIGLLNNDIEVISPNWLDEMVSHALRPGVGAVGARLWYPNKTLQHGGVILGIGGAAGHSHKGISSEGYGYSNRAVITQNYSAVTAACLIIRKSIYEQVNGLNETNLAIAYNDVDFCIRVVKAGYRNVWTPYAELYHHESATRGHEDTPEKKARLAKEMAYLKEKWNDFLLNDPCYSPNLTLEKEDFSFAWPPRTLSNESFLLPYDSDFQENEDFSSHETDIKAITFYLPQFHACKQNDEWWGKGFTEWTNTKQSKPQFEGHYQPREPHDDIGYYDLSDIETMRKQAKLAREHGIYGFCFYHYWFSGDRILEKPVDLLIQNLDIDLKFCLCWANENWTRTWDGQNANILLEQKYLREDPLNFIIDISKYISDHRYIRIDNKPVIIVYKPHTIPNAKEVFSEWRKWWRENRGEEILIWCTRTDPDDAGYRKLKNDIDAVVEFPPAIVPYSIDQKRLSFDTSGYFHNYQQMISKIISGTELAEIPTSNFYRSVMLGWDNSARRKKGWSTWFGFSLESYYKWLCHTISYTRKTFPPDRRFVFINAWNEWAEGTYLEPDKKYGYSSINTTSRAIFSLPLENKKLSTLSTKEFKLTENKKIIREKKTGAGNRIAIVVHAFYFDVFNDIVKYINDIDYIKIDLYITCSRELENDIVKAVKNLPCQYNIMTVENRGRDVLPFLNIMPKVIEDGHEYVLKIHTKKTVHRTDGDKWRAELLDQLIGKEELKKSLEYMDNNSDVGILGPVKHVIPMKDYYGSNKETVELLAKRLGLPEGTVGSLSFVAGTMFIARTKAIQPLLALALKDTDFEKESAQTDGTLAHAIERALSASSWASGMRVSTISETINSNYNFAAKTFLH